MGGFMKVLIVKRLESSFYAFRKSIERFLKSYEMFIKTYKKGYVYVSKKYSNKIFEFLELGDDEAIQSLIDEGKAEKYEAKEFRPDFIINLKKDLKILKKIKSMWEGIKRDPKLETLLKKLATDPILKDNKLIIFTESKETAVYLTEKINSQFNKTALLFHGDSSEVVRREVIENFDPRATTQKDDYKILISTDVLSEGVNLHRSNIVINYDIPWNPTRLMQRVGRVNRIDTRFDRIYTFHFFPTKQADSELELTNIARSKIEAFMTLLGDDSLILTEGEPVSSHELFDKLISKKTITQEGEEEASELKYLRIIEDVRNKNPELFEKIKRLPKKARSAKAFNIALKDRAASDALLTFFRKGKLMKFFLSSANGTEEVDFLTAAEIFETRAEEPKKPLPLENYYKLLGENKAAFSNATIEGSVEPKRRRGSLTRTRLLRILRATQSNSQTLTEDQEEYLKTVIRRLEEGALPQMTIQQTLIALNQLQQEMTNPLKVVAVLQREISSTLLKGHYAESAAMTEGKREVILSLYLARGANE